MISDKVVAELRSIIGKEGVLSTQTQLLLYEYDASFDQAVPEAVVLPLNTEQVSAVV